jgi:ribose transport system permease protein
MVNNGTVATGAHVVAADVAGRVVRRSQLERHLVLVYSLAGCLSALAGIVISARGLTAQAGMGMMYELYAIAMAVIGGVSLAGGRGSIIGTVIGALIMATLTNGLRIMSIPQEWQKVAVGVVILLAVYTDILRRGKDA